MPSKLILCFASPQDDGNTKYWPTLNPVTRESATVIEVSVEAAREIYRGELKRRVLKVRRVIEKKIKRMERFNTRQRKEWKKSKRRFVEVRKIWEVRRITNRQYKLI